MSAMAWSNGFAGNARGIRSHATGWKSKVSSRGSLRLRGADKGAVEAGPSVRRRVNPPAPATKAANKGKAVARRTTRPRARKTTRILSPEPDVPEEVHPTPDRDAAPQPLFAGPPGSEGEGAAPTRLGASTTSGKSPP